MHRRRVGTILVEELPGREFDVAAVGGGRHRRRPGAHRRGAVGNGSHAAGEGARPEFLLRCGDRRSVRPRHDSAGNPRPSGRGHGPLRRAATSGRSGAVRAQPPVACAPSECAAPRLVETHHCSVGNGNEGRSRPATASGSRASPISSLICPTCPPIAKLIELACDEAASHSSGGALYRPVCGGRLPSNLTLCRRRCTCSRPLRVTNVDAMRRPGWPLHLRKRPPKWCPQSESSQASTLASRFQDGGFLLDTEAPTRSSAFLFVSRLAWA